MLHTSPEERIRLSLYKHRYTAELAAGGGGGGGGVIAVQVCEGMAKAFFGFFYVCRSDIFCRSAIFFFFLAL